MSELDEAAIWNRACSPGSDRLHLPGDRALADMILVHSLIMNGGVHHALEALTNHEVAAGIAGYSYFNLAPVAAFLAGVRDDPTNAPWTEANEIDANRRYHELVPDDDVLVSMFGAMLRGQPHDFERVRGS